MPTVSKFYGIIILMYFKNEHNPPHFHVKYNEYFALFSISDLKMLDGHLPNRVKNMVLEWADMHRDALMENWVKLQTIGIFDPIAPLE